jgi:hypothetical protein
MSVASSHIRGPKQYFLIRQIRAILQSHLTQNILFLGKADLHFGDQQGLAMLNARDKLD